MSDSRPGEATAQQGSAESVHPLVRVGAAWTWRLLVLFAGLLALGYVVSKLESVVIPVALALLFAAFLMPAVDNLHRRGVPRSAAVLVAVVGTIGIVGAILSFVVQQFVEGLPDLSDQFTTSVTKAQEWLTQGPLHFSEDQIRHAGDNVVKAIQSNQEALTSGALTTATVIGEIFAGAFLTLFTLVFFLYGGNQVWEFVTRIIPKNTRGRVRLAGRQGFNSLVHYTRATVAVAAVDAIGIGAGLAILGVPLALPLASLVFVGAFIPIVGAFVTGFLAVLVALVTKGLLTALIVLGIIVGIMQLEGHVLQPLLLGRAVRLHPLAVVLAITTGIVLAGIVGGLLAVPIVAFLNTAIRSLCAGDTDEAEEVYESLTGADPSIPMFPATPDDEDGPPSAGDARPPD
ncbi:AI-2E family transporter [Rhodococcus hoagii]|uniref:AI-2E family transporter n=1 Tax=Rhodococcus hoagii TaxID=43767 RepID=A0AAE5CGT5_RHOHA|nr:AI-2E family transporter [Prescottella equi]MBM4533927.1 AI-2E family transporter [Prescottella equi]NKR84636.1 AI-2E family transporter [Prescottella equi]NKS03302.1 AI-2E family transporter [Prescottella equi]NKS28959.1 AI-2E family transporter [Prescottella equi]NKS47979.1 AI-2E family transporter [Prescottella equi]